MDGTRRVLVVVGDETMREMLRAVLDLEEFHVATAGGREHALAMLGEFDPDVLVVDASGTDLDGVDFSRALREREASAHLPILLLVPDGGMGSPDEDVAWDDELVKPVSPLELIGRLATLRREV